MIRVTSVALGMVVTENCVKFIIYQVIFKIVWNINVRKKQTIGQRNCSIIGRYSFLSVHCSRVVTCWERANLLTLSYLMFSCVFCHFPMWNPGSGVVLDCIDY